MEARIRSTDLESNLLRNFSDFLEYRTFTPHTLSREYYLTYTILPDCAQICK